MRVIFFLALITLLFPNYSCFFEEDENTVILNSCQTAANVINRCLLNSCSQSEWCQCKCLQTPDADGCNPLLKNSETCEGEMEEYANYLWKHYGYEYCWYVYQSEQFCKSPAENDIYCIPQSYSETSFCSEQGRTCIKTANSYICAQRCSSLGTTSECKNGYGCYFYEDYHDANSGYYCLPKGDKTYGKYCSYSNDCILGAVCYEAHCYKPCKTDKDCDSGETCEPTDSGFNICVMF